MLNVISLREKNFTFKNINAKEKLFSEFELRFNITLFKKLANSLTGIEIPNRSPSSPN